MDVNVAQVVGMGVNVRIEAYEHYGTEQQKLISTEEKHNLVTLVGRNCLRDILIGSKTTYAVENFAIGTGASLAASGNTSLVAEIYRDIITKRTPSDGKLALQYYLPSTIANGNILREAGIIASDGTLFARVTHQSIDKSASVTVIYNWDININAG